MNLSFLRHYMKVNKKHIGSSLKDHIKESLKDRNFKVSFNEEKEIGDAIEKGESKTAPGKERKRIERIFKKYRKNKLK